MLRAGARGLCAEEAAVELVLRHGHWIGREDFTGRFVREQAGPERAGDQPVAAIDWRGAVEGLELVLGGFDHVNITLVAEAVLHGNGTAGGMVIVPAPPAYPPGVRVVAAGGTVLQEGGAGGR
jgi:hypothetical protein